MHAFQSECGWLGIAHDEQAPRVCLVQTTWMSRFRSWAGKCRSLLCMTCAAPPTIYLGLGAEVHASACHGLEPMRMLAQEQEQ